jgi:hypothetical protein
VLFHAITAPCCREPGCRIIIVRSTGQPSSPCIPQGASARFGWSPVRRRRLAPSRRAQAGCACRRRAAARVPLRVSLSTTAMSETKRTCGSARRRRSRPSAGAPRSPRAGGNCATPAALALASRSCTTVSVDWDQAEWSGHSLTAPLSGNVDEYWRGAYEEAISRVLHELGCGIYGCVLIEVQIVASVDPDAREAVTETLNNVMASANAKTDRKKRLYSDLG